MKRTLTIKGRGKLGIWKPGLLQTLLLQGIPYEEAKRLVMRDGGLFASIEEDNLIVTGGKELAADILMGVRDPIRYCALGTGTADPSPSDTRLASEGARKGVTSTSRSGFTATFSTFFTAAEATLIIEEAGMFGGAATSTANSGDLFSRWLTHFDNSGGDFDVTVDYELTIS